MIRQGAGDGSLDLAAVARDDLLLDVLGRRLAVVDEASDPTARLLQALTAEVDDGLVDVLATPVPYAGVPSLADHRRRRLAHSTVVAVVLGATLSVGGVSAAVTGDPLSAYRSVVGVLVPHDDLPPDAARIAKLNRMVTNARALARAGDPGAAAALEALRTAVAASTDLSPGQRKALARKITALGAGLTAPDSGAPGAPGKKPSAGRSADAPGRAGSAPGSAADRAEPSTSPQRGRDEAEPSASPRKDRAAKPRTRPAPDPKATADGADRRARAGRTTGEGTSRR